MAFNASYCHGTYHLGKTISAHEHGNTKSQSDKKRVDQFLVRFLFYTWTLLYTNRIWNASCVDEVGHTQWWTPWMQFATNRNLNIRCDFFHVRTPWTQLTTNRNWNIRCEFFHAQTPWTQLTTNRIWNIRCEFVHVRTPWTQFTTNRIWNIRCEFVQVRTPWTQFTTNRIWNRRCEFFHVRTPWTQFTTNRIWNIHKFHSIDMYIPFVS